MPADFDMCVKNGGKIRTKPINKTDYMHICYDSNGTSHAGEVKKYKKILKTKKK